MTINIAAFNAKQLNTIMQMLAWMEMCGNIGHCTSFRTIFDGDGTGKIKVSFDNDEEQRAYDAMRKWWLDWYDCNDSVEPVFTIGE